MDQFVEKLKQSASKSRSRQNKTNNVLQTVLQLISEKESTPSPEEVLKGYSKSDSGSVSVSNLGNSSGPASFEKAVQGIIKRESGGNYQAKGPLVRSGDRAYGKYQIMGNNLASWGKETVGRAVSAQEFLASPQLQETIARAKLKKYYDKWGPVGMAKAWYGGPGSATKNSDKPNYAYVNGKKVKMPSLNQYSKGF